MASPIFQLSSRLHAALSLIPRGARAVADIGADHGKLAATLALSGVPRVIATEVRPTSATTLRANLRSWGMLEGEVTVDTRVGAFLAPLRVDEVDGVVFAGVGYNRLIEACRQAPGKGLRWMVLQCPDQQGAAIVESFLASEGWTVHELRDTFENGHLYWTWLVGVPQAQ